MITYTCSHLRNWPKLLLIIIAIISFGACTSSDSKDQNRSKAPSNDVKVELASQQYKVIYGEDTRQDVYELVDSELEQRARRSIVAIFDSDNLNINAANDVVTVQGGTLGRRFRLCNDQRYRNQIAASSCSATLIDDDVVVTAGHCVESQAECESKRFVFGYYMQDSENLAPINTNQVFTCQRLLSNINRFPLDYAFIQLDRAVDSSIGEPANVFQDSVPVELNSPLVMMGFPSGLPLKVDAGGFVSDPRGTTPLNYFRATVDAFGGNSGSGVFNSEGEQVGILVRGETDYVSSNQRCTVVNELNLDRGPGEDAEEITYLSRALTALCDSGYPSQRLCGEALGGLCIECEQNTDCQAGLQCGRFQNYPNAPSFCAPPCMLDTDCPENHQCIQSQCTPLEVRSCIDNQVIVNDACGRRLGLGETCSNGDYCREGSCQAAAIGNICQTAVQINTESQDISGSMARGISASTFGSCGGEGPEVFYQFDLEQDNRLIATARGFDTVLHLRTSCELTDEIACVDDSRPPGRYGSRIDQRLDAGTYYLVMDSFNPGETGNYQLSIEFCEEVCLQGEQRCTVEGNVERCSVNREGCVTWQSVEDCGARAVCNEGRCVLPEPGDNCENAEIIELNDISESQVIAGELNERHRLNAGSQCSSNANHDRFYSFELERASIIDIEILGDNISAVALYSDCPTSNPESIELSCNPAESGVVRLNESLAPGSYSLVVTSEEASEYTLDISIAPDCVDECELGIEPYCDTEQPDSSLSVEVVRECLLTYEGCTKLIVADECSGRVCADGFCQEECTNDCALGEHACLNQSTVITCVADERGCTFWSESNICNSDELCIDEGLCVSEASAGEEINEESDQGLSEVDETREKWSSFSGPKEVELPVRSRGGCEQKTFSKDSPIYPILLSLLLFRIRSYKASYIRK